MARLREYVQQGPDERAENVCEHGDHPAPAGRRFCGYACETCEHSTYVGAEECSGLCERLRAAGER